MVASLSVFAKGQRFISAPAFVDSLLSFLVPGTPRVQRALLRILGRILPRLSPDKLTVKLPVAGRWRMALANAAGGLGKPLPFLLFCVASTLQGRIRGVDDDGARLSGVRPLPRTHSWRSACALCLHFRIGRNCMSPPMHSM